VKIAAQPIAAHHKPSAWTAPCAAVAVCLLVMASTSAKNANEADLPTIAYDPAEGT
jgi:hypothetical protein